MINLNGIMSPNNHVDRSMGVIAVSAMVVSAGVGIYTANKNAGIAKDAATDAKIERDKQQAILDEQKAEYKAMNFTNPYANMENVYEDLTVNQQQAQFQAQIGSQQRANIMQGLRGAAGSSGIAGLAQSLANQGQLQTQQISASIGQQESRNQLAAAQGAAAIQSAERGGDQWLQEAEGSRQATLLGMQMGTASGANVGYAQAQANQMQAQMAQNQAWADGASGIASTAVSARKGGKSGGGSPRSGGFLDEQGNEVSVMPGYEYQYEQK